jgi:hypothetical protein
MFSSLSDTPRSGTGIVSFFLRVKKIPPKISSRHYQLVKAPIRSGIACEYGSRCGLVGIDIEANKAAQAPLRMRRRELRGMCYLQEMTPLMEKKSNGTDWSRS